MNPLAPFLVIFAGMAVVMLAAWLFRRAAPGPELAFGAFFPLLPKGKPT